MITNLESVDLRRTLDFVEQNIHDLLQNNVGNGVELDQQAVHQAVTGVVADLSVRLNMPISSALPGMLSSIEAYGLTRGQRYSHVPKHLRTNTFSAIFTNGAKVQDFHQGLSRRKAKRRLEKFVDANCNRCIVDVQIQPPMPVEHIELKCVVRKDSTSFVDADKPESQL